MLLAFLEQHFELERDRLPLWLAVGFGTGIGVYFSLASEPQDHWAWALPLGALVIFWRLRMLPVWGPLAALLLSLALGFALADWRADQVTAPRLTDDLPFQGYTGIVQSVERRDIRFRRIVLDVTGAETTPRSKLPKFARLVVRTSWQGALPGDQVEVRAKLLPPPIPALPGAYDFPRAAWFQQLGATGFAVSPVTVARDAEQPDTWTRFVRWRLTLIDRLLGEDPTTERAVAVALLTGERGAIPDEQTDALRDAGLAHVLAISGLHVGLFAGAMFILVRLLMAAVPYVAVRWPGKKIAAIFAVAAAGFYLAMSGQSTPTVRAFIMFAIVMLAVLLDRVAISMRLVALAAVLILLFGPEDVLHVGFQMSFAAVVALVALYETDWARRQLQGAREGAISRLRVFVAGLLLTSLVAGLATDFIGAVQFNRIVTYNLAGNLLAVPLMGLWIMPMALAAFVLMPLGLESFALTGMEWGIAWMLWVANWVSAWPGAVLRVATPDGWVFPTLALGGAWLCLWRTRWRLWGLVPMAVASVGLALSDPPDILVSDDGKVFAVRHSDGGLALSDKGGRILRESWLQHSGNISTKNWQETPDLNCDALGCVYQPQGSATVALITSELAITEDCPRADVVVSAVPLRRHCPQPDMAIDRFDLWRKGAHAIWLGEETRVESIADRHGGRPWSLRPRDFRNRSSDNRQFR